MELIDRNSLVMQNLDLVHILAWEIGQRLPSHVAVEDLVELGTLGLVDAADKFTAERNVKFSSYARFRIRGAILDGLRRYDTVPREVRKAIKCAARAEGKLESILMRTPTAGEVAAEMRIPERQLDEIRVAALQGAAMAGNPVDGDLKGPIPERGDQSAANDPFWKASQSQMGSLLDREIQKLKPRHRLLVVMSFIQGSSDDEIAAVLGVTKPRVSQLRNEALGRLLVWLRKAGIRCLHDSMAITG